MKKIIYLAMLSILFGACQNTAKQESGSDNINLDDTLGFTNKASDDVVKKIFYNIPSPTEMSSLLKKAGLSYNPEFLHSYKKVDEYTTVAQTSLNLGVYGADLSYNRLYNQTQQAVNYFSAIKRLSDALGIPQEQGGNAVERLESNIENKDSLLVIITEVYSNADRYLKENNRGSTAALIVTGGWIEAMYLAVQVASQTENNEDLVNLIAEQKFSLDNLLGLLKDYPKDKAINTYLPKLENLKKAFKKVNIIYSNQNVTIDEENSLTTIGGESKIEFDNEDFVEITNLINELRNEIIH